MTSPTARGRWGATFGILLAGGLVWSCSEDTASPTSGHDAASPGSGGAHASDAAAAATGGGGATGGVGTGGIGTGGAPGTGGASVVPATGSGGAGTGGKGGAGGVAVPGTGGSSRLDAANGGGGTDAAAAGGKDAAASGGAGGGGTGGTSVTVDSGSGGPDGGAGLSATLGKCADATDDQVRAFVYGTAKAPALYDWNALPGGTLHWDQACASELSAAQALAKAGLGRWDKENVAGPYYYEFIDETSQSYAQGYRVTKCDFFDGSVLGKPYRNAEGLALLASYLWFVKNRNSSSHKIIAAAPVAGAEPADLFLCYTLTVFGDWGLYDEIHYYQTRYSLDASGMLTVAADQTVRTIQGKYNPTAFGP